MSKPPSGGEDEQVFRVKSLSMGITYTMPELQELDLKAVIWQFFMKWTIAFLTGTIKVADEKHHDPVISRCVRL